jgi:hypothetical protein
MNTDLIKGVFIGFLAPIILFVLVVVFYEGYELSFFINELITDYNLPIIISLTLFVNLVLFLIKFQTNKDEQARGVLFSTILYGVVIVYLKFL